MKKDCHLILFKSLTVHSSIPDILKKIKIHSTIRKNYLKRNYTDNRLISKRNKSRKEQKKEPYR
jgi:hypothetical protein